MPGFGFNDSCSIDDGPISNAYNTLLILSGLTAATLALVQFAESKNPFHYESRVARVVAGFMILMMRMFHSKNEDLELGDTKKSLIAIGPHRTGWEGVAFATKMKGPIPPRFFATDAYNAVPGVPSFMKMFKTIPVKSSVVKGVNGKTSNSGALDNANQVLRDEGCVALFPQGNFSKLGQKPPRVYVGAAKLALEQKIPIHVIRLDGFWCLTNPFIPLSIRNNAYYRAFLSLFHMNNIRTTLCCMIDFHLKPENQHLSEEEKIHEICAQLYAYYRHTNELTDQQIDTIKTEISQKTHCLVWDNKVKQDDLGKQLSTLEKEAAQWEPVSLGR